MFFFCTKSPCISKYKGRPKLLASVAKDNMILFPVSPCASEPTVHLSVAKTPSVSQRIWHPSVTWLSNCEQPNTFLSVWYHDLPDVPCTWLCYQILKHIQLTNQKVWKKKKIWPLKICLRLNRLRLLLYYLTVYYQILNLPVTRVIGLWQITLCFCYQTCCHTVIPSIEYTCPLKTVSVIKSSTRRNSPLYKITTNI